MVTNGSSWNIHGDDLKQTTELCDRSHGNEQITESTEGDHSNSQCYKFHSTQIHHVMHLYSYRICSKCGSSSNCGSPSCKVFDFSKVTC